MTGSRPAVVLARLGVVERQSSHADDDDALFRADDGMAGAWAYLSAMQGDEVQKRVADVAKALYPRTDETAVLIARAITRHSWSSPLMFGCRRRGAAPDRVNAEQRRYVSRVDGRMPTMTCTATAVQQTIDRRPRGAITRPF
jgi:hypothetical protein